MRSLNVGFPAMRALAVHLNSPRVLADYCGAVSEVRRERKRVSATDRCRLGGIS